MWASTGGPERSAGEQRQQRGSRRVGVNEVAAAGGRRAAAPGARSAPISTQSPKLVCSGCSRKLAWVPMIGATSIPDLPHGLRSAPPGTGDQRLGLAVKTLEQRQQRALGAAHLGRLVDVEDPHLRRRTPASPHGTHPPPARRSAARHVPSAWRRAAAPIVARVPIRSSSQSARGDRLGVGRVDQDARSRPSTNGVASAGDVASHRGQAVRARLQVDDPEPLAAESLPPAAGSASRRHGPVVPLVALPARGTRRANSTASATASCRARLFQARPQGPVADDHPAGRRNSLSDEAHRPDHHIVALVALDQAGDGDDRWPVRTARRRSRRAGRRRAG